MIDKEKLKDFIGSEEGYSIDCGSRDPNYLKTTDREQELRKISFDLVVKWYSMEFDIPIQAKKELQNLIIEALGKVDREQTCCAWKLNSDLDMTDYWSTSCENDFCLIEEGPEENDYNFCPGCGGKIKEEKTKEPA